MAEDKILRPTIQEDTPFPGEAPTDVSQSSGGQQVFRPTETKEQEFPKRVIASELISSSIDSMSKKILGEYKFTSMGAIKIGQIKISDDGILGEDVDGRTTFALDPDTGDATFRGRILAGSVIATEIQGEYIVAGTITADKLNVTTLSAITANLGTITAGSISGVTIAIGSSNAIFKADSNGIYLGNATFASAPFRVSMAGAITATSATITGELHTGTGSVINGGYIDAINAGIINAGTLSADRIGATSITADKLNVSTLSAISANVGTITSGTIKGVTIELYGTSGTDIIFASGAGGTIYGYMSYYGDGNQVQLVANAKDLVIGTVTSGDVEILEAAYISGDNGTFYMNQSGRLQVSNHLDPGDGGSYNLGGATRYWNDVSYKTLTDRGCLGWFDEGVEMQDGKTVTDTEALLAIQKHPTLKTIYGTPRLDYKTLPKVVYKKASKHDGTLFERDKNTDEPLPYSEESEMLVDGKKETKIITYQPQDGAETTALLSIMLGAIKELTLRVKTLENK